MYAKEYSHNFHLILGLNSAYIFPVRRYSTYVYTKHVQGLLTDWKPADKPIFLYMAWQAVHEPMAVPDSYRVAYNR